MLCVWKVGGSRTGRVGFWEDSGVAAEVGGTGWVSSVMICAPHVHVLETQSKARVFGTSKE